VVVDAVLDEGSGVVDDAVLVDAELDSNPSLLQLPKKKGIVNPINIIRHKYSIS
jgi:hypothetical protein